jgi:glutathione synthase/RimK-type ligase-like ATP-grasp enzyme
MILLWGLLEDPPMSMVYTELQKSGANVFFLDHREIFASEIECEFNPRAGDQCVIRTRDATLDLSQVKVAYVRTYSFYDYAEMQDKAADDPMALKAAGFEMQLVACLNASDKLVINRSDPSATNNSKPCQLDIIRRAGFKIPETFITNDSRAARRFLTENPDTIYKSISGVRSIVQKVSAVQLGYLDDVAWCPTLFQKVVPGINYRVHVLDQEIFAVRIMSDRLDYRYGNTTMVPDELPADVAQKCRELNSVLGLHFSGIDLMRTPSDEWFCFEANPSPAYSYFQLNSGLPISTALAKFMIEADVRDDKVVARNSDH